MEKFQQLSFVFDPKIKSQDWKVLALCGSAWNQGGVRTLKTSLDLDGEVSVGLSGCKIERCRLWLAIC